MKAREYIHLFICCCSWLDILMTRLINLPLEMLQVQLLGHTCIISWWQGGEMLWLRSGFCPVNMWMICTHEKRKPETTTSLVPWKPGWAPREESEAVSIGTPPGTMVQGWGVGGREGSEPKTVDPYMWPLRRSRARSGPIMTTSPAPWGPNMDLAWDDHQSIAAQV